MEQKLFCLSRYYCTTFGAHFSYAGNCWYSFQICRGSCSRCDVSLWRCIGWAWWSGLTDTHLRDTFFWQVSIHYLIWNLEYKSALYPKQSSPRGKRNPIPLLSQHNSLELDFQAQMSISFAWLCCETISLLWSWIKAGSCSFVKACFWRFCWQRVWDRRGLKQQLGPESQCKQSSSLADLLIHQKYDLIRLWCKSHKSVSRRLSSSTSLEQYTLHLKFWIMQLNDTQKACNATGSESETIELQ